MKEYNVLIKKDNGTKENIVIEANNASDARWIGRKMDGVYEAVVMNRIRK